ncbi:pimeloyl-ACP methyl ester carboxylesterase [Neolewinella xylanilytica]|uniref:Pimeloyl-ACP methyl ester carboxylesterase n=1 Tax=Neolewinella xylanilytica TaxID=1514080 RepID=A0A2S6I7Q1_9BACT|nr:alpha/beta hydrolase [Neolewinella xylanilytica]PPK87479.1 pimeloyl-ACP methyl ester carboxylesterase [Neolewinella xylanilytica]
MTTHPYSDEALVQRLPGFTNHYATVNGITLHYVAGGSGQPLLCLPGWPQTWYSFHPIAGRLAERYRVILIDLRGMGTSEGPPSGYDKKTMAADLYALVEQLGLEKVSLIGHDIGGMVATSFAFNYPERTEKLVVMDGAHPSEGLFHMPLIPAPGTFGEKMDDRQPYAWWMGFNQVKGLPEQLLAGRFRLLLDYLFAYVMIDDEKMSAFEREVYAHYYDQPDRIRSSNAWYQTLTQDIADARHYSSLTMPVLGIGSRVSYGYMQIAIPQIATDHRVVGMPDSGHYMIEEQPDEVLRHVLPFLSE